MDEGITMADPKEVNFHYIKAPQYAEHPMHGIFGGVTTSGQVSMSIFSERQPLPKILTTELIPVEGEPGAFTPGGESRSGLDGLIRFVHNTYYLDINMAKAMRAWLDDKIATFEGLNNA